MVATRTASPRSSTADADEDLQANLQHVVMTYDSGARPAHLRERRLHRRRRRGPAPDCCSTGIRTTRSRSGNEVTNNRTWRGIVKIVAIYEDALTPGADQAELRLRARRSASPALRPRRDARRRTPTIEFTVSEFDAYSYLFCAPMLETERPHRLHRADDPRLGERRGAGREPELPHAEHADHAVAAPGCRRSVRSCRRISAPTRTCSTSSSTRSATCRCRWRTSARLAAAAAGRGLAVGGHRHPRLRGDQRHDVASSRACRVTNATVRATYLELHAGAAERQRRRGVRVGARRWASRGSRSTTATRWSRTPALRNAFFGVGFDWTQPATTTFATRRPSATRSSIRSSTKMLGTTLANQPTAADVRPHLDTLIDQLTAGCTAATVPGQLHAQRGEGRLCGGALERRRAAPLTRKR